MTYQPTPKQEQALREWLQEAIVPLIEQVLVKKLGQAMSFAAQEVVSPKRTWVGLTDAKIDKLVGEFRDAPVTLAFAIEAELKELNT